MSNFKSTTQIFNDVYSGSSLNVYNYGSTSEVLNAVIDETNDAIRVNLIGGGGETGTSGTSGIDGVDGTSGIDGLSGATGADGLAGTSGIDGVADLTGIQDTAILFNDGGSVTGTTLLEFISGGTAGIYTNTNTLTTKSGVRFLSDNGSNIMSSNGSNGIWLGSRSAPTGGFVNSVCIGDSTLGSCSRCYVIGNSNSITSNNYAYIFGKSNTITGGGGSLLSGLNNKNTGGSNVAQYGIYNENTVTTNYITTFGQRNTNHSHYSNIYGTHNTVTGSDNQVFGGLTNSGNTLTDTQSVTVLGGEASTLTDTIGTTWINPRGTYSGYTAGDTIIDGPTFMKEDVDFEKDPIVTDTVTGTKYRIQVTSGVLGIVAV